MQVLLLEGPVAQLPEGEAQGEATGPSFPRRWTWASMSSCLELAQLHWPAPELPVVPFSESGLLTWSQVHRRSCQPRGVPLGCGP